MEERTDNGKTKRAFTIKAVAAGLIGIFLIAGGSKFAPTLAKQDLLVHQLGIGIYFYFFVICLFWNPLCTRFIPALALNIKELALAMIMTFTAGGFAWYGWMKQFATQMIMITPKGIENTNWKLYHIDRYLNMDALPNGGSSAGPEGKRIIGDFINGIDPYKNWVSLSKIPFAAWEKPLLYWGSLILIVALLSVAMLLLVHRQWVRNEKLTYPLVSVAESLFVKEQPTHCFAAIFRSKMFWIAFGLVIFIHAYNYWVAANQTIGMRPIPLTFPLSGLSQTFPIIRQAGCDGIFAAAKLSFLLIALAYFLAPSLSLSIGLNGLIYLIFAAQVYETTGSAPIDSELQVFRAGAYLAFFIMLIFLGRHYYGSMFLKALFIGKVSDEDKPAVFGARLFILTALATVFLLTLLGMDLIMAVAMTMIVIIMYTIFTRIVCEAGIPIMVTPFMPTTFFAKMFGGVGVGPQNLFAAGQSSGILFGDMKQLLMPYLATGFRLCDRMGIRLRRIAMISIFSIFIAFFVAFGMHLWQYYSMGISDAGSKNWNWGVGLNEAVNEINRLGRNEQLTEPEEGLSVTQKLVKNLRCEGLAERISQVEPEKINYYVFFLLGLGIVFLTGFLRTRFLWWPFHAVLFCIWNTVPANWMWFSFLFGWFLRTLIVRLGGEKNYIKMKPIFLGLIFGEVGASGLILLYGVIYYLVTKTPVNITY